jgi:hypothetical protein
MVLNTFYKTLKLTGNGESIKFYILVVRGLFINSIPDNILVGPINLPSGGFDGSFKQINNEGIPSFIGANPPIPIYPMTTAQAQYDIAFGFNGEPYSQIRLQVRRFSSVSPITNDNC